MRRFLLIPAVVGVLSVPTFALPTVNIGNYTLLPDKTSQQITLHVSGGDAVEGLTLYVQVGDGGPAAGGTELGPAVRDVDTLTGTIFQTNNLGQFVDGGNTRQVYAVATLTSAGTVSASGLLATLTLDTTGLAAGTWTLSLQDTAAGTTDFAGLAANLVAGTLTIPGGTSVWTKDANAAFSNPANWASGNAPAGASAVARFGPDISADRTVSLNGPVAAGRIEFDSPFGYRLSGTGGQTITLAAGPATGQVSLDVQQGSHVIAAPLLAPAGLAKTGPGDVTLQGSVTVSGNVEVTDGHLIVASPLRPVTGSLVVTGPGAIASLAAAPTSRNTAGYTLAGELTGITATSGGSVIVPAVDRSANKGAVVVTSGLALTGAGAFDLGNSDLVVRGGAASLAQLQALVSSGTLFASASQPSSPYYLPFTTLAVFANVAHEGVPYFTTYDDAPSPVTPPLTPALTTPSPSALTSNDVIIKYTYIGDTNLDGVLNGTDLANVIEGLSTGQSGWAYGDLDNSGGVVTLADFSLFLASYGYYQSHPQVDLGTGQGAGLLSGAVPEPRLLSTCFLPAYTLLGRRRRA